MYIERDLRTSFDRLGRTKRMLAILGPRQSGKTTFLRETLPRGGRYVLFDDPVVRRTFEEDLRGFQRQYLGGGSVTALDEVQRCEEAGPSLRYLVDTGNRLWVTASSEFLLGIDVLSHLVGRVSILRLLPFNLREFLRAKDQRVMLPSLEEQFVREHMTYGGYPEVVLTGDPGLKEALLMDLRQTVLLLDVLRGFPIQSIVDLERLSTYLAVSPGAMLSYEDTAQALSMDRLTVKKYVEAMAMSSMLYLARPFFTNRRKELVKRPRVYYIDTGLRNAIAGELMAQPSGGVFENYVVTELLKMGHKPKYWRTTAKVEVDLVVESGRKLVPIEVKLHVNARRVERGLRAFIDHYAPEEAFVVGLRGEVGSREVGGCEVRTTTVGGLWEALGDGPVVPPERGGEGPERDRAP